MNDVARAIPAIGKAEALKAEIARLKGHTMELFTIIRDYEIRIRENRYLAMAYFGPLEKDLEYKRLTIRILTLLLRRMKDQTAPSVNTAIEETRAEISREKETSLKHIDQIDDLHKTKLEVQDKARRFMDPVILAQIEHDVSRLYREIMTRIHPDLYAPGSALASTYARDLEFRGKVSDLIEKAQHAKVVGDLIVLGILRICADALRAEVEGEAPPIGIDEEGIEDEATVIARLNRERDGLDATAKGLSSDARRLKDDPYANLDLRDNAAKRWKEETYTRRVSAAARHIRRLYEYAELQYGEKARASIDFFVDECVGRRR